MVSKPSPTGPSSPQKPDDQQKIQVPGKGFKAKPMTFLGMYFNSEQATKLWQVLIQSISNEISKLEKKSRAAIKKMGADGADSDD